MPSAELLLGHHPHLILDLVLPSLSSQVTANQKKQKLSHNQKSKAQSCAVEDCVYIRDFPSGKSQVPGKVESICGPLTYWIELTDGRSVRQHVDHILNHSTTDSESDPTPICLDPPHLPNPVANRSPEPTATSMTLWHSSRISHPPDCYGC